MTIIEIILVILLATILWRMRVPIDPLLAFTAIVIVILLLLGRY